MKEWIKAKWLTFITWWAMDATDIQKGVIISFGSVVALAIVGSIIGGSN